MDQQLKTRLIGVTIIVSLVVIFVPMLFEDSSEHDATGVSSSTAPEFPQEFQSQALPLPPPQAQINTVPSTTKGEVSSVPMRDEPLDPLDVPAASGSRQIDDIDSHDASADAQDALLPEKTPNKAAALDAADDFAAAPKSKPGMIDTKPQDKLKPLPALTSTRPAPTLLKPVPPSESQLLRPLTASPSASKAVAPITDAHAVKAKEHAGKDAAVKMSAWVIQAGSFADEANAKTVLVKLRQAKINAFVEMIPSPSGNSYRVRVGPELDRAKAEAVLKKMESDTGVKGMIVSYP